MKPFSVNHRLRQLPCFNLFLMLGIGVFLSLTSCGTGGNGDAGDGDGAQTMVAVGVSPGSVTLEAGQTQPFSAAVTGTTNSSVTWTVQEPSGGTIDANGLYAAPTVAGTYHITATSVADNTKSDTAAVTVTAGSSNVVVTILPSSVDLAPGGTQQFDVSVTGTDDDTVAWSVVETGNCGHITATGLYTAPGSDATCHVHAASNADNSRYATATVHIGTVEATIISIDDTVVVPDIKRLGVNLGDDVWYNAAIYTKERIRHGGFEGILYRTMGFGPSGTANTYLDWWDIGDWASLVIGADAWFVSGPRKWDPLIIESQAQAYYAPQDRNLQQYTFTPQGELTNANDGFLIEVDQNDVGFIGQHGGAYWVFTTGNASVTTEAGDVPPNSEGRIAAVLSANNIGDMARLLAPMASVSAMDVAGVWEYSLWCKGSGTLSIALGDWSHHGNGGDLIRTVNLNDSWQKITGTFSMQSYPSDWDNTLSFSIQQTNGMAQIDEVSVFKQGDVNPTPFRDDLVNLLKDLKPGSLRHLQIGGSSIDNALRPRKNRMAYSHSRFHQPADGTWPAHPDTNGDAQTHSYGLHEFLQLCEEVGTDPWYCTSGTLKQDEFVQLMEYLGGPAGTPMGDLRIDRGHPTPWTQVFNNIHIEVGNEAWNSAAAYANGGYNGQEYWSDLFASAKASPYYRSHIKFHAGGQAVNTWLNGIIAGNHYPQADALALAPYVIHSMSAEEAALNDEQLYSWIYGFTWYNSHTGFMQANYDAVTDALGMDLSIYEVNHHITGGDGALSQRNKIVDGLGGALNVANWMLLMLERQHVRVQNIFTLIQDSYNDIRLWGIVLSMQQGQERYRPLYLAARMINEALIGDLVQVTKSGTDPVWNCPFTYDSDDIAGDIPYLHAYATRSGRHRGLILINLHRTDSLPVEIDLPHPAVGSQAVKYELTGVTINANNEPEHDPQVFDTRSVLTDFNDNYSLSMQPHSMVVLIWNE
jgi:alpha-L-arabinofuranosidase